MRHHVDNISFVGVFQLPLFFVFQSTATAVDVWRVTCPTTRWIWFSGTGHFVQQLLVSEITNYEYGLGRVGWRLTLPETKISHLGKGKIINSKSALVGDMLVPRRVYVFVFVCCMNQSCFIRSSQPVTLSNTKNQVPEKNDRMNPV